MIWDHWNSVYSSWDTGNAICDHAASNGNEHTCGTYHYCSLMYYIVSLNFTYKLHIQRQNNSDLQDGNNKALSQMQGLSETK